ncbi:hypothetical protein VaNZ11_008956 [Volvox africanus]|uniref:Uncharacterized protein n=1 Tax=Volvox africanus TaxID=51714 RepID=A0ABQ5S669_9CHLO|nr:hypothetical protein VaNZ11_008956 [Volvox africanus]
MEVSTIKSCKEEGRVQRSCDVEGRFDQDENKHNSCSVVSVLSVRPQAEPSTIPPAEVADSPETPLAYARRPGGFHIKSRGAKRQLPRLPSSRQLLASPKLHAIELKIEGPHLCDLPQDFAARLRAFLTDALGMAPLHMAVGQGCIHLVVMLLEVARGAGPVIFLAHRHRRSRTATAGFGSLPTRLMAFMSEVLPVGSAGAPEHVEIRHSQRSYELNASPAQGQQLSGGEQSGRWQAGRIVRSPPQTYCDATDGVATAVAASDDEYTYLETPSGVAVAARTDPAGVRAAIVATATTTMRTSAPASSAAAALVLGSSGGTWGSSSAGRPTRSWVAWPVSPGPGAAGSNTGGSHMNSDAANGGTSQMASDAVGGVGPSLRTDAVGGNGADERKSWLREVATPREGQQHEGQRGELATELAAAGMASTVSASPLNISYACHSFQRASQQLHQHGQPVPQRAETVAVPVPSQAAGERAQQQPSRVASGSRHVAAQTARSGPARIWVSEPTKDETMEAQALKDGYLERISLDFDGSTNVMQSMNVPCRSWVCDTQEETDESRVGGSGARRSGRGNLDGAAPSAGAVAAMETALVFRCAGADGTASMAPSHPAGQPIPGLYDGGAGTGIGGDAQRPAKVATCVGAVATAAAARCNSGSGGGVRRGGMVLRQAARGAAASGDISLTSDDGGGNCGGVSGALSFAAFGPTLADRQEPSTGFGPSGWAGTPYPPAVRILSPAQMASLNPGHQQAIALATATTNTNTTLNTVIVRPFGDGGIGLGGFAGNQNSCISGGGSVEIPEALAGLLMPQVPLAVARLHSQSHARAVELLSPAVVVWPPLPAPPPPRTASPEALGTGLATTGVDPGRTVGRVRPGVSRLAPLQSPIQQLAALAPAQTLLSAQPTGELCLVMRCPDVIASGSKVHGRTVDRENPSQRDADGSSSSSGDSGGTVNGSCSANAISGEDGIRWGCSTDSLWTEANQRNGSGSVASSSGLGQVSQLVAWNRNGAISLLQVDDSAEGCTRATLLLPLPLPPPLISAQPDLRPPPSPRPAWERSRAVSNAVRSSAEVLLMSGNSGAPGSGSAGGGSSRGASSAPLESRATGDSPRGAGRGSAGGGFLANAANAALGAHLLYVAWRRGQSLGPPCPLLLLPSGFEDVVSELQALQPQPAQPPQLQSYQAFISDLGTWLEALHALTSMPWTSPLPSSGTACGNGNVGGGGVSVGIVGGVAGSDSRSYHSLQSSSSHLSRAGTGIGTASGSNVATGTSVTGSPAHGEPLTWRSSLGNYGGSLWRAVAPAEHIGSTATVSARLAAATMDPTAAKARGEAAVSGIGAAGAATGLPVASELNTELSLDDLAQRAEEQLSPFHATGPLSSAIMMNQPQQPLPPVAASQPAAPAQPLSQGQRAPSASTLFSGSDVPEEKIVRFVDEVFCLGCDLLVYSVGRGAVATARFIMGRLLSLGPQAACIALLGSNGAAVPTASTTAAVAAAGQSSSTSPSRSVGSTGTRGGAPGLSKLSRIVGSEMTVTAGSLAVRSALFRAVLDTCRSNSEFGRTLLHLAVLSQSLPMVRLLLEIWPQENGLPASELNRLDKAGLPPAAYLPQAVARGPQASCGADGSSGAAEFAMAAEPMLLALGRPLPVGDSSEAAVDVTEVAEELGRWGLQAVQEGSSEAASLGASGVRVPGAASAGSGFVATGSSGDAEGSAGPAVWEARRFSGGEVGRSLSVNILSDGGGSDDGGGTWRRASSGRRLVPAEDEPARGGLRRPLAAGLGAMSHASAAANGGVATAAAIDLAGLSPSPPGPVAMATATAAGPQVSQMDFVHQAGDPARPLLRWALWATVQMLLGSVQALVVLLFAMPRARDLPPSASLLAIPGALLWLPSLCLALTSCLSAVTALLPPPWPPFLLLLQPQWQEALPSWLPAAVTSMGRALACVMSLAAAVQVSSARRGIRGGDGDGGGGGGISEVGAGHGGLLMLMAGGRGMSGAEASARMLFMTLAPTALEAVSNSVGRGLLRASRFG